MPKFMNGFIATLMTFAAATVSAHVPAGDYTHKPILTDIATIKALNLPLLAKEESIGVGYTIITPEIENKISALNHSQNKCAGFQALDDKVAFSSQSLFSELRELKAHVEANERYSTVMFRNLNVAFKQEIADAISQVEETELKNWVTWLSSFETRYNKGSTPNLHVDALKLRLETMLAASKLKTEVSLIDHKSTPQKSIRVRIEGSTRPSEIIVLGGHLDSISGYFGGGAAPGADDNASGSSNLLQALRVVLEKGQPERTIEFFWYAGEESGLLGSAEIAKQYKKEGKNVIAALQLDMTLFPGDGELVLGSMTDFTSAWLRQYLEEVNSLYLKGRIVYDKCGYGCSDHASWFQQGYPTLMPFEASFDRMNNNIHTARDVIDSRSSFTHSAFFSKIAVVFALDLANSTQAQPY